MVQARAKVMVVMDPEVVSDLLAIVGRMRLNMLEQIAEGARPAPGWADRLDRAESALTWGLRSLAPEGGNHDAGDTP